MSNSKFTGVAVADPLFESVQIGTSLKPTLTATSGIINGFYGQTSAPTGDTRLNYQKLTFTSTGSGETLRAFSVVTGASAATGGTINGAHISTSVNGSGTISGAANAIRATLGGSATTPGGTLSVIQLDSDFASGVTVTGTSFLRVTDTNTTKIPNLLNLPNPASNTIFRAKTSAAVTHVIKIISADGTPYYMMVSDAA